MTAVSSKLDSVADYPALAEGKAGLPLALKVLTGLTAIGIAVGLYFALAYAEPDATGNVQRIFYIHMPAFIGAFVAFSVTVLGGVMYLRTRAVKWDSLALAGVEVGMALTLVNLITGMIWAKPLWGTYWTWDPRLTLEAIQALTYAAYLMLRAGMEDPEKKRRFASVYGILAIITVIMVIMVIRVRTDTIHPSLVATQSSTSQGGFDMTSKMKAALGINMGIWALLVPITLIWYRLRLQNLIERLAAVRGTLLSMGNQK